MKNATKHADTLHLLLKKLTKEYPSKPRQAMEPLRALVRAAMSYDVSEAKADEAMRAIEKEFVDLNELRVATDLEIHELLGVRYPAIERRVAMITQALNNIFEREHTMNLERLKTVSRRDARQFLRELPDIHPFVEAYVMLYAFEGHTCPMDAEILAYLLEEEAVEEGSTIEDAQRFVEYNLKPEEMHDFFSAVRAAVSRNRGGRKR